MKCPKCDFEVTTKVNFCPYCGHDLSKPYEREEFINAEIKEEKGKTRKSISVPRLVRASNLNTPSMKGP